MKTMMKAKRKAHKELRIKLVYEQRDILREANKDDVKDSDKDKTKNSNKNESKNSKPDKKKKKSFHDKNKRDKQNFKFENKPRKPLFEENDFMTCYEGYWIRKASVKKLEAMKIIRFNQILQKRTGSSDSEELTKEENIQYQRMLKKEKRNESHKLRLDLKNYTLYDYHEEEYKGFESYCVEGSSNESAKMTKFDGFWVRREGAERLKKLKGKVKIYTFKF